jgi:cytochrome c553
VQEDWYLMDQLRKFKMDWRGYDPADVEGNLMRNIAKIYSINDLKDIVAYIARMEEDAAPSSKKIKEGEVGESER